MLVCRIVKTIRILWKPAVAVGVLLALDLGVTFRVIGRTEEPSFWPPSDSLDLYTPTVIVDAYRNAASQAVCEATLQVGYTYRLQRNADLTDTNGWEDVPPARFGSTNRLIFTDPDAVRGRRFYRVVR